MQESESHNGASGKGEGVRISERSNFQTHFVVESVPASTVLSLVTISWCSPLYRENPIGNPGKQC